MNDPQEDYLLAPPTIPLAVPLDSDFTHANKVKLEQQRCDLQLALSNIETITLEALWDSHESYRNALLISYSHNSTSSDMVVVFKWEKDCLTSDWRVEDALITSNMALIRMKQASMAPLDNRRQLYGEAAYLWSLTQKTLTESSGRARTPPFEGKTVPAILSQASLPKFARAGALCLGQLCFYTKYLTRLRQQQVQQQQPKGGYTVQQERTLRCMIQAAYQPWLELEQPSGGGGGPYTCTMRAILRALLVKHLAGELCQQQSTDTSSIQNYYGVAIALVRALRQNLEEAIELLMKNTDKLQQIMFTINGIEPPLQSYIRRLETFVDIAKKQDQQMTTYNMDVTKHIIPDDLSFQDLLTAYNRPVPVPDERMIMSEIPVTHTSTSVTPSITSSIAPAVRPIQPIQPNPTTAPITAKSHQYTYVIQMLQTKIEEAERSYNQIPWQDPSIAEDVRMKVAFIKQLVENYLHFDGSTQLLIQATCLQEMGPFFQDALRRHALTQHSVSAKSPSFFRS